jgi:TRAP-type C4-dicarboxylate transport system permease small subunit
MPKLVRLYIVSVAIGFALSALFVAALVWLDVGHLRHLVLGSDMGWVAALMLVMFNGVVFAGAQFAIAVMQLADKDEGPKGGRGIVLRPVQVPVPVTVTAPRHGRAAR